MRKIILLVFLTLLAGCTTGERMSDIQPGMTKDEVTSVLGRPDGYQSRGEFEALKYSHRLVSGWAWDRADYFVILNANKVVEYGAGEVRVKDTSSNVLFLVPLK
jgi:hypothetical protein